MSRWRWGWIVAGAVAITVAWWWSTRSVPDDEPPSLPPSTPTPAFGELDVPPVPPVEVPEPAPVISGEEAAVQLAGANGVVCSIQPEVSGGSARLVLDEPDDTWLAVAAVGAGFLVLSEVPPEGTGTLRVEGFAPVELRWSEALDGPAGQGGCDPEPVVLSPADAAIVGTVDGAAGRASLVSVEACGQSAPLQDDGSFYLGVADGERCEVVARRHLGVYEYASSPVEVVARAGRDAVVELSVPDVEAVVPVVVDEGLVVTSVWDGALELVPGDRIVAIDGEPAPTDRLGFYVDSGGATGDLVVLEVQDADGAVREVEVGLQALGFDDWLVHD